MRTSSSGRMRHTRGKQEQQEKREEEQQQEKGGLLVVMETETPQKAT